MTRLRLASFCFLGCLTLPSVAHAVASGEVYTAAAQGFGRFEARIRFAAGDGVVSSFFLWKDGSEVAGTFWNELDFEKLGADCRVEANAIYGNPQANHIQQLPQIVDPCGSYHTYAYEWTPDSIAWIVDGVELRRDVGETPTAFAENAPSGMQLRFNVWPGDVTFGGNFSPDILPVHQYIDWVQFSSYEGGAFTLAWREDFDDGLLPTGWATANWGSPKNLSTHDPRNVNFIDGHLVISLTADDATGPAGAIPVAAGGSGGLPGAGGADGMAGGGGVGAAPGSGGNGNSAGSAGDSGSGGTMIGAGGTIGSAGTVGSAGVPGSGGSVAAAGGSGQPGSSGGASGATGTPGTGGVSHGTAGAGGSGGTGAPAQPSAPSASGCSIHTPSERKPHGWLVALTLGAIFFAGRRRTGHRPPAVRQKVSVRGDGPSS